MAITRFGSQASRVYDGLREMILTGEMAPGERIGIRDMAEKLKASNGPIRDALLQLSNERLVERGHGVEWSVAEPTREMIDGGMVVREALEVQSARLCAQLAGANDIERLRKLALQIDALAQELAGDSLVGDLDGRLHMTIAEVSGSLQLCEELERWKVVMDWAGLYLRERYEAAARPQGDSHVELINAIATGEAEFAERQMRRHVHYPWDDVKWHDEEKQASTTDPEVPKARNGAGSRRGAAGVSGT